MIPSKHDDDIIECQIESGTTDSEYICLSYVWGLQNSAQWILINGEHYKVRQNLWYFLYWGRQTPFVSNSLIWVDALCINQFDYIEKAHLVQQMGSIFSGASEVVSWFGTDPDIARFLDECYTCRSRPWSDPLRLPMVCDALPNSHYWRRAWITQEFTLPKRITLMAQGSFCPETDIPYLVREDNHAYSRFLERLATLRPRESTSSVPADRLQGRSLIYLLSTFRSMACGTARDRVFSLLALSGDGSNLRVNYHISAAQLICNMVSCCSQTVCVCCIAMLAKVLELTPTRTATEHPDKATLSPFRVEFNIPVNKLSNDTNISQREDLGIHSDHPHGDGPSADRHSGEYWCRLSDHSASQIRLQTSFCGALYFQIDIYTRPTEDDHEFEFTIISKGERLCFPDERLGIRLSDCQRFYKFQVSLYVWLLMNQEDVNICQHAMKHEQHSRVVEVQSLPRVSIIRI